MVLRTTTPHGGPRGNLTSDHGQNTVEGLLIAHKKPQEQKKPGFTVNKRLVGSDVSGMSTGPIPPFLQNVENLNYPPGAPNGGPRAVFLPIVVGLLMGRLGSGVGWWRVLEKVGSPKSVFYRR